MSEQTSRPDGHVLRAGTVTTPTESHHHGWVHIVGDRVRQVGAGEPPVPAPVVHLPALTVLPGFVDAHTHGGGGFSYSDGDPDAAANAARTHLRHGTTSTVASLVSAPLESLERAVRALADLVDDGLLSGVHLEGPWLSERHRGAHAPEHLRPPRPEEVERLLTAGRGTISMVTLAPELDGGIDAVRRIVGHGAVAAIGHTDATYATTRRAIDAGATVGTHLFNGMRSTHHREPGPAVALTEDGRCRVELIADGHHLHDAMLRHAALVAGTDRVLLVSDSIAAAGAPDGRYRVGELDVVVRHGQARLATTGSLAGSTLTLDAAVRRFVEATGYPLGQAVRAASSTPARTLGLTDAGSLAPGHRADLVAVNDALRVEGVMRAGRWVIRPGS
ncbi:N-acetylglucosamine-6-phosphate deacetylase [Haloechinothrix alba]|uniref:N-acetylglucosamine-6-phosphate deacetylase n=1 Tax=Haloechinothrix alba TaxID=664784 RepID=UPI000B787225|nr:N-acetylglucosamine-6-phosphate deacetylase [Haloechinothrix alba]